MFGSLHSLDPGALKVAGHGLAGGISSVLNRGKFGHGFLSAGLTQTMGNAKGIFTNAPQGMIRIGNAVKAEPLSVAQYLKLLVVSLQMER